MKLTVFVQEKQFVYEDVESFDYSPVNSAPVLSRHWLHLEFSDGVIINWYLSPNDTFVTYFPPKPVEEAA